MRRHYKGYRMKHESPEALIDCAFHEFGCVDKLKRKDEQKHYEDASCTHSHLKQIADNQTQLTDTIESLVDQHSALTESSFEQANVIERLSDLVQSLQEQIDDLEQ